MTQKQKRFSIILCLLGFAALGVELILSTLKNNIVFFYSPSEVREHVLAPQQTFRLGGLVLNGSFRREGDISHFTVTDNRTSIPVTFTGQLPDLFREGQGIVAEGQMQGAQFIAQSVLAKHDETYMPREVADALKKQGLWHAVPNEAVRK